MIRWKYVAPRLTLIVCVWLATVFGTDPLLRWSVVQVGQRSVGARVDLDRVHAALRRGAVEFDGLAIANPSSPMANLFEAHQTALQVDTTALMQRRLVVSEGRMSGIRFGTERTDSGRLDGGTEPLAAPAEGGFQQQVGDFGEKWLDTRTQQLENDLKDNLESVRVANELAERWPQSYAQVEAEVKTITQQTTELIAFLKQTTDNPLRALEVYREASSRLEALRHRSVALRENMDRLKQQMQQDKSALAQAKKHDASLIREHAKVDSLNPENLSRYLLGPEFSPHVARATHWIGWFRQRFPGKEGQVANSLRGEDVVFRGLPVSPSFLIQRLALDGEGQIGNHRVPFLGELTGATNQLRRTQQPMTLRLRADGPTPAEVVATREATDQGPRDHVVVNCPAFPMPQRQLGKPDQLALAVSEGTAHLWSDITMNGDVLRGQIIMKQEGVVIQTTSVPSGLSSLRAAVDDVAANLSKVEVLVNLDGTLSRPEFSIQSNLGPHLAQAVHGVVERELTVRAETLVLQSQKQLDTRIAELETRWLDKQRDLLDQLQIGDQQIQGLVAEVAQRIGVSQRYFSAGRLLDNVLRK